MQFFYLVLSLHFVHLRGQFRGFSNARSGSNHDLLKQIVEATPEDEEEQTLSRFGGRRTSILDRARNRPSIGTFPRSRPRFKPSIPRFGANSLNVVTQEEQDQCQDLRSENELLKQLVDKLTKQQQAVEAKEKLLQQV